MAHVKEWCWFMAWASLHFWKTGFENSYLWLLPEWSFLILLLWSKCRTDFGPWDVLWKVRSKKHIGEAGSGQDEGQKGKWKNHPWFWCWDPGADGLFPSPHVRNPAMCFDILFHMGKGTQRMCLKKDFPTASAYGVLFRDMVVYHLYSYK